MEPAGFCTCEAGIFLLMTISVITVERVSLRFQIVIDVVIELIVISGQADFIVIRLPDPVQVDGMRGFNVEVRVVELESKGGVVITVPE